MGTGRPEIPFNECNRLVTSVDSAQTSSDVSDYQSLVQRRHWYTKNLCRSYFVKVRQFDSMLFGLGQLAASIRPISADLHPS